MKLKKLKTILSFEEKKKNYVVPDKYSVRSELLVGVTKKHDILNVTHSVMQSPLNIC